MQSFTLKGSLFPSSVLKPQSADLQLLAEQLKQKVSPLPQFFYMSPVVIDCSELDEEAIDFELFKSICQESQLNLFGITGLPASAKDAVQAAGLSYMSGNSDEPVKEQPQVEAQEQPKVEKIEAEAPPAQIIRIAEPAIPTKIVTHNIRSGQQIYAKGSDLIIQGAVSNGAEVVADGNIHIYGSLRGRAIAGAAGDQSRKIFCSKLEAELVSVAGNYWLNDQLPESALKQAVVVQLEDEKLTVNTL